MQSGETAQSEWATTSFPDFFSALSADLCVLCVKQGVFAACRRSQSGRTTVVVPPGYGNGCQGDVDPLIGCEILCAGGGSFEH